MYVPYNCYKATYFVDDKELLGPHHLNRITFAGNCIGCGWWRVVKGGEAA